MKVAMHHATIGNDGQDLEPMYLELNIDQANIPPGMSTLELCIRVDVK
jgi:hypothetical protein